MAEAFKSDTYVIHPGKDGKRRSRGRRAAFLNMQRRVKKASGIKAEFASDTYDACGRVLQTAEDRVLQRIVTLFRPEAGKTSVLSTKAALSGVLSFVPPELHNEVLTYIKTTVRETGKKKVAK